MTEIRRIHHLGDDSLTDHPHHPAGHDEASMIAPLSVPT